MSIVSPAGKRTTERRTGVGTPNAPPAYRIVKDTAPFTPSRSGESEGAMLADVGGADRPALAGTDAAARAPANASKAPSAAAGMIARRVRARRAMAIAGGRPAILLAGEM
jgi:hypothetical protein